MANNSVSLHRVFKAEPEKVFRAFTDPSAIASWLPPYGYLCIVHEMNVEAGGIYKMSFKNFTTNNQHSFSGEYHEIRTNEFLKYSDVFDDPDLPGEMMTTITLTKVSVGTDIKITQDGIPEMIPSEA